MTRKHNHYFKDVAHLTHVDVYRVLTLFNVTDPCIQHAIKKLLVAGGRGAGKDITQDIKEAIDSLERWHEMQNEGRCKSMNPNVQGERCQLHAGHASSHFAMGGSGENAGSW